MTPKAKVRLLLFSIDSGYKELYQYPESFVYDDETFIEARDKLSKNIIDLSPKWIKYSLLDVQMEEGLACAVYGGLVPANTPINKLYSWRDTQSNYLSKVVSSYA